MGGPDSNSYVGDLHSLALHHRLVDSTKVGVCGARARGLVALGNVADLHMHTVHHRLVNSAKVGVCGAGTSGVVARYKVRVVRKVSVNG